MNPDQMTSEKLADQDLHCFQKRIYPGSACMLRVKLVVLHVQLLCFPDTLLAHNKFRF